MPITRNRRHVLAGLSALIAGLVAPSADAEEPLETTSVRLPKWENGGYCWAALYMAGEMLRAEGFTDVRYVQGDPSLDQSVWIANGETDFSVNYPPLQVSSIDAGWPIKVLSGLHSGCLELIANDSIHTIADLRGKRLGVNMIGSSSHTLLILMATYVGLDPAKDIHWVVQEGSQAKLFMEGKIDAFLGSPPRAQELRNKKIGHVILNTTIDQPWSQYFCCMVSATTDYVDKYPVATKRVLRAILQAADHCVRESERVARQVVERGFVPSYDYALQTLKDIRYDRWRNYDPEDSLRFYALRMQETGMIKSTPGEIIAKGADWRFVNELRRELKG